ncbi:acyltransferase family protein [Chitinophaga parva]|nr:acyltransferase [Chitinophaga parva]
MTLNTSAPRYFFSLDMIRGFAALIVVLCHWQFFFYKDYTTMEIPLSSMPLPGYRYLSILYTYAPFAVDLFFLLSGFIFFWFYADKVANRDTSFNHFFCFRLSRLYPVHLAALVVIALLQYAMIQTSGAPFIIQHNDTWHFILNLLLIHCWGFEKTPALNGFNGPSWSVSVEFFLYLLFFAVSYARLQHKKGVLITLVVAGAVLQYFYSMIGQGIYSFYLGALVYHAYNWMLHKKNMQQITRWVTGLALLVWIMVLWEYYAPYLRPAAMRLMQYCMPSRNETQYTSLFNLARNTFVRTIVSPATILTLALLETARGGLRVKWLQLLGNISYALYLLHFPLMVLFALVTKMLHIPHAVFQSPLTMLLFYAILIPLSTATHYYFELPVQQFFRRRLSNRPVQVAAATARA